MLCCRVSPAQVIIALLFGDKLNTDKLEFGLVLNPCWTNISGIESSRKSGLHFGLYFNVKLNDYFTFHPELIAKGTFGARDIPPYPTGNDSLDALFASGSILRKIKAFGMPLLIRGRIKNKLHAEGGLQINWHLKTKDMFEAKVNGNDLEYTTEISDDITTFDVGVLGGLVYKLKKDKGMALGVRYFYGLTDVMKTIENTQRNDAWLITISIPVGAGKSNDQKKNVKMVKCENGKM